MPVAIDPQLGEAICDALRAQAARLGVPLGEEPRLASACIEERRDPFSQEISVQAIWRGAARDGCINFFADGRVFAEYQVLQAHPSLPGHYIEAVQVWGRVGNLRGEPVIAEFAA